MVSQGRGRRGRGRGGNQPPSTFDQEAFIEAIGAAEDQVTFKGLWHIILKNSQEKGTQWLLTIDSVRAKRI